MNYLVRDELNPGQREKLKEYSDMVAHLLFHRDITDSKLAKNFLEVDYEKHTHNSSKMKDIDKTVDRILLAIENNEKVCVFSDYDADGIPGAVVLTDFFRKIGYENFFSYIPHRNREGFGLNNGAIEKIIDDESGNGKTKVLITIDCGITDVEQINNATDAGIDVIITDHHDPNGHTSNAFAIINPKQEECNYPYSDLCGAGVIFKVVQALVKRVREEKINIESDSQKKDGEKSHKFWKDVEIQEGWEKWLLDMVGIATLSDMVPLVGENRVFAKYGLFVMQKSPRKGFQKLLKKGGVNQLKINEMDVGFTISPRINAASRMDSPELAYEMLSTTDDIRAAEVVKHLDKINNERKGHVAAIVRDIHKQIKDEQKEIGEVIVFGNPKWQPSLMGLVASKMVDEFGKPAFIWGRGESETLKGSCRSDGSLNLVELMNNVDKGIIFQYGGHEMAGGFEITDEGVFDLEKGLNEAQGKTRLNGVGDSDFGKTVVDRKVSVDDLGWPLFNEINKLAPFGVGNTVPTFLIENADVLEISFFGKEQNHLKVILRKTNGQKFSAIQFFMKESDKERLKDRKKVSLIANIENSNFGGWNELRLRIIDVLD